MNKHSVLYKITTEAYGSRISVTFHRERLTGSPEKFLSTRVRKYLHVSLSSLARLESVLSNNNRVSSVYTEKEWQIDEN